MTAEVEVIGLDKIQKGMASNAPQRAIEDNLEEAVLKVERKAKMSTVVDTGRLRASIVSAIVGNYATVGTNVSYAPYIEYGTQNMKARHMEGSSKVLGVGMMAHTVATIGPEIKDYELKVAGQIEKESIG